MDAFFLREIELFHLQITIFLRRRAKVELTKWWSAISASSTYFAWRRTSRLANI